MAFRGLVAAGGDWDVAASWMQCTNTPSFHASTAISITTTPSYSAAFTAPNLINTVLGMTSYLMTKGAANNIIATLQEDLAGGGSWADTLCTATIPLSDVNVNTPIFFSSGVAHPFATTSANRYRWKLVVNTGTATVRAASTGTTFNYFSWDNRAVIPTTGDMVDIVGANGSSTVCILKGTRTCGIDTGGLGFAQGNSGATVTSGIRIANGGRLEGDQAGNCQLTCTGELMPLAGGELRDGTTGSPLSSSYLHTWIFTGVSSGNGGIVGYDGGKVILQGAPKLSSWKAGYVSGLGTAASPMVTDGDIGEVGDEILVSASSANGTNYNETEPRFIITKNSSTSYVLSTSSGGSEAALTYTHTNAKICNVQRNIVLKGSATTNVAHFDFQNQTNTGNVDIDWVRFENVGATPLFSSVTNGVKIGNNVSIDYSVGYYGIYAMFMFVSTLPASHTGLIAYSTGNTSIINASTFVVNSAPNKTFTDCYSMQSGVTGWLIGSSNSGTYERCYAFSSNTTNTANNGAFVLQNSGKLNFIDTEIHANRGAGLVMNVAYENKFNSCLLGTKGVNQTSDISIVSSTFATAVFEDCTFGSATRVNNYQNSADGSDVAFQNIGGDTSDHGWYTNRGTFVSEETTVRTPGSLSLSIRPENNTVGGEVIMKVPANPESTVQYYAYLYRNATFSSGTLKAELFLPGTALTDTPDASVTLPTDVDEWLPFTLTAYNPLDVPRYATIRITAVTSTAGAYAFLDDIYDAGTGNKVAGLDLWDEGHISPIIVAADYSSIPDQARVAVWSDTDTYTGLQKGKVVVDGADNAELAAIK